MLEPMNDRVRKLVALELVRRDMSQKDLAEKLDRKPQQINDTLRGRAAKLPGVWQDILDTFEWELRVFDRDGNEVK